MADRAERIRIFEETMQRIKTDPSLRDALTASIRAQIIYPEAAPIPESSKERFSEPAKLILSHKRTFEAAEPYAKAGKHVCVLNFASTYSPGGGVTRGASAQEECLCRISTLYPALTDARAFAAFYQKHRDDIAAGKMGRENNADCIYTPDVTVICEDTFDCALLPKNQWYKTDVITCAAPDLRWDLTAKKPFRPTDAELETLLMQRTERIVSAAAAHGADVLILGAFGCGVFLNPPETVAKAFAAAVSKYSRAFETVEFAVYTGSKTENYDAFRTIENIQEA